jgi:hypothetical protein
VVLQNGCSPTEDYTGEVSDQITDYRDSVRKADVGVQWGLKVGAFGGLQRVLIRFEGLEAAIGKARVRAATLELYQIDSPKANGAALGLYRLKRRWVPDGGSWICYDTAKNLEWSTPGAAGDADIENKEEAHLNLDNRKDVWRSFDVTAYLQDVLAGKAENHGLLLRVVNGEPNYHVRFYPETDLEAHKDKTLRPRLILQLDRPAEPDKKEF